MMTYQDRHIATDGTTAPAEPVRAVNSAATRTLYKAREPIYPKLVHGRFRALKWGLMVLTLGVYYLLPWVRWERGPGAPDQAVLVDFTHSRFYFFFIEIWPQEVYYITGLLVLAALVLFLVTALFGRVWCGYFCPQTVWTDLFIMVERMIEGDRNQRIRLDRAPWSAAKAGKKIAKHGVWLTIGLLTGGAWVFYFHDAPTIAPALLTGDAPGSAYVFMGLLTLTTYLLGGLAREQVCTYMCPWPRIQAAMIDAETFQVTYRRDRGEPRGPHKKGDPWTGRGHCIDCSACVAACPMGIDIRDGAQLECINCALCIDACDDIMARVGLPRGLIAYDSDLNLERRRKGEPERLPILRVRTILYAGLIALVGGLMLFGLATRDTVALNVLKDRAPAFVRLSDGAVRNGYTLKVLNKENAPARVEIGLSGVPGAVLKLVGSDDLAVDVEADRVRVVRAYVTLPAGASWPSNMPLTFSVRNLASGAVARAEARFTTGKTP